jgi:hypothetical protein
MFALLRRFQELAALVCGGQIFGFTCNEAAGRRLGWNVFLDEPTVIFVFCCQCDMWYNFNNAGSNMIHKEKCHRWFINLLFSTLLLQICWNIHASNKYHRLDCAWDKRTCCRNKRRKRNSSARHCVAVPREAPSVVQETSVHSRSLRCRIHWRQQGLIAHTGPDLLAWLLVRLSYLLLHRGHGK